MLTSTRKGKIISLFVCIFFFQFQVSGQKYGNEWIDTSKLYIKVGVANEGIYRLGYFAIESHFTDNNVFLSTVPLSAFRLYTMGEEVPVYVYDQNSNNVFDPFDYIEFVGHPSDGKFDTELYPDPADQRHTLQSLISDTAYYFLTYRSTGTGLRYSNYTNSSPPATAPKAYHRCQLNFLNTKSYHNGIPFSLANHLVYLSEYSSGEGFVGDDIYASADTNSFQYKIEFKTPYVYTGSGGSVGGWLETGVVGASVSFIYYNHRMLFKVGPTQTQYRTLLDTTWLAHGKIVERFPLANSDFGSSTWLLLNSRFVNNINFSLIKHSHSVLNYPRLYNLGDSIRYWYTEDTSSVPVNIEWENYGDGFFSLPLIYDETNRTRIVGTYITGQKKVKYTLPPMSQPGKMFMNDEGKVVEIYNDQCRPVRMVDFSKHINKIQQYLIVTSAALYNAPKEEVKKYAKIWDTRYNVTVSTIEDIYNSFSYGIPHPQALRHYCKYLLDKSATNKPKYLLLIGRGYDMSYNRGTGYALLKPQLSRNHIPALGTPVSDFLYTMGLNGAGQEPAIPTGRIPADVEEDVGVYRTKLEGYLNAYNNYEEWQKTVLHLSGGATVSQAATIKGRLADMEKYPEGDPFAGTVFAYSKASGAGVDVNFRTTIMNHINAGVNLVTFLGHGSNSVTDVDVGNPNDYLNENKYPICYFNGCQVGNPCLPLKLSEIGISEKIFRADRKGAIAFLGQTSTSELYTVASQMEYFYKSYFDSVEDKTLGNVVRNTIKNFQNPNSMLNKLHCQQLFLQGDPALPIYAPQYPDFAVSASSLFLDPPNTIALQDSFRVGIIMKNLGKGVPDSFTIELDRTYPDGSTRRHFEQRWRMHGLADTAYITIKSKDKATAGDNVFAVNLNRLRNPVEFNYNNNTVSRQFYIPANGINLILPERYAIIGTDSVELVVQKSDLFKESEDFYLEIDTTPWFNSPILQSLEKNNTPLNAGVVAKWKVKLPSLRDTQVYFWRARINVPANQGGTWNMSSFTYIKNHGEGWMQNLHWQYEPGISKNEFDDLHVDSVNFGLKYSQIVKKIYIDCEFGNTSNKGVKEGGFGSQDMNYGVCKEGIVAITWDGRKVERTPVDTSKIIPDCYWGTRWTTFGHFEDYQLYYTFDMSQSSEQDNFIKFIDAMDDSMYVTFYTRNGVRANLWKPGVRTALNKVGSTVFDTASWRVYSATWVAVGKKGWKPGQAQEVVSLGAYVQLEGEMTGDADRGTMISEPIGPTNQFRNLIYRPLIVNNGTTDNDKLTVDVLGLKSDGNYETLLSGITALNTDLTSISSNTHKFLRLRVNSKDTLNRTSPNLYNWRVVYDPVPEGTLFPDLAAKYKFHEDTLYEGDTFYIYLPFKNISKTAFRDSLRVQFSISNKVSRVVLNQGDLKMPALAPDSMFWFIYRMPTTGLNGPYGLQITVNPQYEQPEKTLVNNSSLINFFVTRDIMSPVLDVTFDGRHILQGDIVSANPVINITSKDENKYLWQTDTSTFDLFLKKPGSGSFDQVKFGTEAFFYPAQGKDNKARIEYRPSELATGVYTMRVQSRDAKLNPAGNAEYEIDFNVVREESITHFYPYPNPFTSSMRFVFTLTGTEVPDEITVKIMTAEGRVVKELRKEDLGDIHVGNNITDWSWDGTDQYGDKLGNGTYFYKVSVKNNGETVALRETKGDGSFKDQVGVIYLMR